MSIFNELKRRNVFRVGIAYAVAAWLALQIADVLIDNIGAPDWVFRTLLLVIVIGFPLSLIMAWAFEVTPDGIKRDAEVDRSESITSTTGRKLDRVIIGMLVAVAAYFIWEARFKADDPSPAEDIVVAEAESLPDVSVTSEPSPPPLDRNAIAVLPFANRSLREEDLFFTDGIHDDLLTQLAKIDNLKVISRTSVMAYRGTDKRIPEIAADLGVGIVLEGGVQRAGDRVRINAQLIDVATDQHLWAETFDREMTIDNIFDIQSEISQQIVAAVKGEVSQEDRDSLSDRPTDSLEAWESYLRAQAILRQTDYTAEKYARAEPLVQQALAEDPDFAEAWVLLSEIQMQGIWMGTNNTLEQREAARQTIARATALSPGNPAVIAAQADYEYRVNNDYEKSLELIDQALKLAPGSVKYHYHRSLSLRRLGRWEESIAAGNQALALNPLDSFTAAIQAETLAYMKDWERLEPLLERWLQIEPDSADLLSWKYHLLVRRDGDLDGAQQLLAGVQSSAGTRLEVFFVELASLRRDWDTLIEIESDPASQGYMAILDQTTDFRLGRSYALKGDQESAASYLKRYLATAAADEKQGPIARSQQAINMADAYAWLGDYDQALRYARLAAETMPKDLDAMWGALIEEREIRVLAAAGLRDEALQRISEAIDQPGWLDPWTLYLDPSWDFFRDDPRFNELVRPEGVEPEPFRAQRIGDGT